MEIEYCQTKNGLETFKINNIFYHSTYDPEKEAERFVSSISLPYTPAVLFIVEPGFNYCSKYLENKFPNTKIYNIRFINEFVSLNKSIFYSDFEKFLFTNFTSEEIMNSFLISWPQAQKIFNTENNLIWNIYKKHLETRKTELVSRQYFEKKWFLNSINFFKYVNHTIILNQTDKPVLIIASGPSLKDSLKLICENQSKFIIIGLSSAINILIKNNIIPDFCVSTDGGFWATKHLKPLKDYNIPIAITSESCIQKDFLQKLSVIPLCYSDGLSSELFSELNFPYIKAERNPTVSGTALILAKQFTTNKVYFAGLDLCCSKGFAHAQPNILELENSIFDNRIRTKSTRTLYSEYSTGSLNIFKENFSLMQNVSNCFRIINCNISNQIGKIQNIHISSFENKLKNLPIINKKSIFQAQRTISLENKMKIRKELKKYLIKNSNTQYFMQNLFPIDFLSINHSSPNDKIKLEEQLNKKKEEYMKKLWRILDDK